MKDSRILREWVDANGSKIMPKAASAAKAKTKTSYNNFKLWNNFVRAATKYIEAQPELNSLKTNCYGDNSGIWRTFHIYDYSIPEGPDISIRFNINTEDYEISSKYDGFDTVVGNGFNLLMSTLDDIAFTIFEVGSFDFRALRESLNEWVDSKGNKISSNSPLNKSAANSDTTEVVYIWDMYMEPIDKGTWRSADKYKGEYDGYVYKTKLEAIDAGQSHLFELEDEGALRGDPIDYTVEAVAIPKSEVSDYTLEFSGLK